VRLPSWLPKAGVATVLLLFVGGWLSTGLVLVPPGEAGIRLTFGAVGREALQPGLHACLPWPMGSITRVDTAVQRLEIGFRSLPQGNASELLWDALKTGGGALRRPEESLSLTGDEGAADLSLVVHFRPEDPVRYFTRTRNADQVLRGLVNSEAREVLATLPVEPLLTDSRAKVLARIREGVAAAADRLQLGVTIVGVHCREARPPTETVAAFRDVFSAGEDRLRVRNQAESYQNQALPRARADQVKRRSEAVGFAHEREERALGEATRFSLQAEAARQAPKVTALRLYLEAMERSLADKKKIIADPRANRGGYHHWLFAPGTPTPAAQPAPAPRPKLLPLPEPPVEE
jgi:membrane protease subunit HflK